MRNKNLFLIFVLSVFMLVACREQKPKITIMQAIKMGDTKTVTYYLNNGDSANQQDEEGVSLLMLAVKQNSVMIVKDLIEAGASVNASNQDDETPLTTAIEMGNREIISLLLEAGATVNLNALEKAVHAGNTDITEQLLTAWTDTAQKNEALITACHLNESQVAIVLIAAGAEVNTEDKIGQTPLGVASALGHNGMVQLLLANGAAINQIPQKNDGRTALIWASEFGNLKTVQILLDNGADVKTKTLFGETALSIATQHGHTEIVKLLKRAGAEE